MQTKHVESNNKLFVVFTCCIVALAIVFLASFNQTAKATGAIKLLDWDLVDSGKHSDWAGASDYLTELKYGVNQWNGYKSGVIRQDTLSTVIDIRVADYSEVSNTNAFTSSDGRLRFNSYNMKSLKAANQKNVATHELGHALGIAHNVSGTVMYAYDSAVNTLTATDKSNYDAAYKKY